MTQEEKAKAYDNVREKIVVRFGSNVANEIFSEYEESEDERIRKDLILYLKSVLSNKKYGDKFIESWIAWLEKQAEQKPTEWNEEDKEKMMSIFLGIEAYFPGIIYGKSKEEVLNWFKSLNYQNKWIPSDEQMEALHYVTNFDYGGHKAMLVSLYEQLKKLRKEV